VLCRSHTHSLTAACRILWNDGKTMTYRIEKEGFPLFPPLQCTELGGVSGSRQVFVQCNCRCSTNKCEWQSGFFVPWRPRIHRLTSHRTVPARRDVRPHWSSPTVCKITILVAWLVVHLGRKTSVYPFIFGGETPARSQISPRLPMETHTDPPLVNVAGGRFFSGSHPEGNERKSCGG